MGYNQKRIVRELIERIGDNSISLEGVMINLKVMEELDKNQIDLTWHVVDVQSAAEDLGVKLTDDQCIEVLRMVEDDHDSDVGVNWDVLRAAVQWYVEN